MTVTIRRDAMQRHDYTEVATSEVAHIGELEKPQPARRYAVIRIARPFCPPNFVSSLPTTMNSTSCSARPIAPSGAT